MLYKSFNAPIAADLKTTSPIIATISGFPPSITRRVAFGGKAGNTDLIWKTYHYMKNSPNSYGYFEAKNEHTKATIDNMIENKAKYTNGVDKWNLEIDKWTNLLGWCNIPNPYCSYIQSQLNNAIKTRDAWASGVQWWDGANDGWRLLIEDLTIVPPPQQQVACECFDYNPTTQQASAPYISNNCTTGFFPPVYRTCSTVNPQITVDVDSDGIVPTSSQLALPGATTTVMLDGNTHFQEVNSPELKNALNKLWNGGCDDFFKTDPR